MFRYFLRPCIMYLMMLYVSFLTFSLRAHSISDIAHSVRESDGIDARSRRIMVRAHYPLKEAMNNGCIYSIIKKMNCK
jgi:hypothetical protein